MDSFRFRSCLFLITLIPIAGLVHAAPVTWTFQDAVFSDGGQLTGSFVYDADTKALSNVNVTLTLGLGYLYPELDPVGPTSYFVSGFPNGQPPAIPQYVYTLLDLNQHNWLQLYSNTALTDEGGTVPLSNNTYVNDPYAQLQPYGNPSMNLTSGELIGTPVEGP